jgi:predicted MPP superfamily phosphohydrolase
MHKRLPRRKIRDIAKAVLPEKTPPHLAGGVSVFVQTTIALQLLMFLLHFMIYETLAAAFGIGGWVLGAALAFLSVTYISAILVAAVRKGRLVRAYYRLAAVWFAFVAPLCGACAAFVLAVNISSFFGWTFSPVLMGVACFGVAVLGTLYGIWNSGHIRITKLGLRLPNIPNAWRGKRLVFISDVHFGNVRAEGFAKRIVKKIQKINPAAVCIGGDLYDGVACDPDALIAPFKELHPPQGIYYVSGNHEYLRGSEQLSAAVARAGVTVLWNQKVDLGGIDLVGVDWSDTEARDNFISIMEKLKPDSAKASILLRHVPDNLDVPERLGISFQLSGHTHHGQFWPITLVSRFLYKEFDYGLQHFGKMTVYTSSGVGTEMSPFRLGTKAEIVVIEFKQD